ncbi:hypothetical protein HZA38_01435 [Candidatus Peregrinibacteria bacterium]|nr:hypothetical protein [Candidatus Peregrinibacteria bacterium]
MFKKLAFIVLLISTFLSWAAWGLVINKMSPYESPGISLPAFYITSLFSLLTTFTVVGTLLRRFSNAGRNMLECINISLRQGTILAGVGVVALFFEQMNTYNWWIGALLLCIAVILESFFWVSDDR